MNPETHPCSIQNNLVIRRAEEQDYKHLSIYHYRDSTVGPVTHRYAIYEENIRRRRLVPVVGVIVYRPPVPNLAARNAATGGFFSGLPRSAGLDLLNRHVLCISRVIIDPLYRGLGLASWLVQQTLPMTGAAMVEASSLMSRVHPFFERAGMRPFRCLPDVKTERMKAALESVGIDESIWIDTAAAHTRIERLKAYQQHFLEQQIQEFLQKFQRQRNMPPGPERTDFVLGKLGDPGRYYLWLNPAKPVPGLQIA